MDVGSSFDELGRQAERLRCRVRVLEAPGVRDERDVERLRELGRQLDAERGKDIAQDLPGRRRVGDDQVDVAETRVVVVMVDVENERRRGEDGLVADPVLLGTVDREKHPLRSVVGRLANQVVERHERVLLRQRSLAREVHHRVLAELP